MMKPAQLEQPVMEVDVELTDTFGGEANYSWVQRRHLTMPVNVSDRTVVRRVKAALNYAGVKCRREDWGDCIVLRPVKECRVIFITFNTGA
jgi:hypothetical protein